MTVGKQAPWAETVTVIPAVRGQLKVSGVIRAAGSETVRNSALVAFEFRDSAGALIRDPALGLPHSETQGAYFYVGRIGEVGTIPFDFWLTPPRGTVNVRTLLPRWSSLTIELVEPLETHFVPNASAEFPTNPYGVLEPAPFTFAVVLDAVDTEDNKPPALVALEFYDLKGVQLEGPFSGFSHSPRYGSFAYLGAAGEGGQLSCELEMFPPEGTARVEAGIYPWGARSLGLVEGPELAVVGSDDSEEEGREQGQRGEVLAHLEFPVEGGEVYDVELSWTGPQRAVPGFALVVPRFRDSGGNEVEPPGELPRSEKLGRYRYFTRPEGRPDSVGFAVASITAPAQATHMVATVLRWQADGSFGVVEVESRCLAGAELVAAEATVEFGTPPSAVTLVGTVEAAQGAGRSVGNIEVRFQTPEGFAIVARADGLESSDQFLNVLPLERRSEGDRIAFKVTFRPPSGAGRIQWRLRPALNQHVTPAELFEILEADLSSTAQVASLAPAARFLADQTPSDFAEMRATLPDNPFWEDLVVGGKKLLGEAVCSVSPGGWTEVSSELALELARQTSPWLAICPVYFDSEGQPLEPVPLPGCSPSTRAGSVGGMPIRYASSPTTSMNGSVTLRESFLTPQGATTAAFYLLSFEGQVECEVIRLAALPTEADAVHAEIDTTRMDRAQIEQQIQVAEATHDLSARRMLAVALAAWVPADAKFERRAQVLADSLTDLNPEWLPTLPPQPAYKPDPDTVVHLFKVIYPDESSGGAVRSTSIVEAQAARGLRPVVCMPLNSPRPDTQGPFTDGIVEVERNGVIVCYPHYSALDRNQIAPGDVLSLETALWNHVLRERRAGLIHAASGFRGYENALKGIALARSNGLPLVYEVRSFHEHTWRPIDQPQMGHELTRLRMAQEDRCMAAADVVVTISQAMAKNLADRGVPTDRIVVVPNAIDSIFEGLPSRDDIDRLRQRIGVAGKTTIGYISNFSQREGHQVLLDAFARLVDSGHDLHLVMPGDGPERLKILDQVRERDLGARVVMPGSVDHAQIRDWYHAIDVFVVPRIADFASDYVTPLKPFEAMSQGIPVIMSERPVTEEIAGPSSERAAVFPAGEPEALARLLETELANPSQLRTRAEAARAWVMTERVWSSVVGRYDEAYELAHELHASRRKREGGE